MSQQTNDNDQQLIKFNKRLIELILPVNEIAYAAQKEKTIRHGHIALIHLWWSRKPLVISRAVILASIISISDQQDVNPESLLPLINDIIDMTEWESNQQIDSIFYKKIVNFKKKYLEQLPNFPLKVLDPFAGGGSIPFEALRFGCKVTALEYNPVAHLIQKALLEFPQIIPTLLYKDHDPQFNLKSYSERLLSDIKKYSSFLYSKIKDKIGYYFSSPNPNSTIIGYIWPHTIPCQNPLCRKIFPLLYNHWLVNNKRMKIALKINKEIHELSKSKYIIQEGSQINFDPSQGTVGGRGMAVCPYCNHVIPAKLVRQLAQDHQLFEELVVVIEKRHDSKGKYYRLAQKSDYQLFEQSILALKEKESSFANLLSFLPKEPSPLPNALGSSTGNWGITTWDEMFNFRQLLVLTTFYTELQDLFLVINAETQNSDYTKIIITYLALAIDRLVDRNSRFSSWENKRESVRSTFSRQAISIIWAYFESNPFNGATGGWENAIEWICKVINNCIPISTEPARIILGDASQMPFSDESFDLVVTDPPYYNSVPYATISDFFYVWLKRSLSYYYPDIFFNDLTPKDREIVYDPSHGDTKETSLQKYESLLLSAFKEIYRVLKPAGLAVIMFTHKSVDVWDLLLTKLLNANLYLTASWAINTEMDQRLRAQHSATMDATIILVCRKRFSNTIGYEDLVKKEIKEIISAHLTNMWNLNIKGANLFISAIGPAIKIYGQYTHVARLSGDYITLKDVLEYLQHLVTQFALNKVLNDKEHIMLDQITKFWVVWFLFYGYTQISYSDGNLLAKAFNIDLDLLATKEEFVKIRKNKIQLAKSIERASVLEKIMINNAKSSSLISKIHWILILWYREQFNELETFLKTIGLQGNNDFWHITQLISEIFMDSLNEKQWIQAIIQKYSI